MIRDNSAMNNWIIVNKNTLSNNINSKTEHFPDYSFYSDEQLLLKNQNGIQWFVGGYVLPRQYEKESFKKLPIERLLPELFNEYGNDFINHIKGNFIIIKLSSNEFRIYSDHFAIKKFFYWQNGDQFIISNNLKEIIKQTNAIPSKESMAVYALTYHFAGGTTLYENVKHNTPGQIIEFKDGHLHFSNYWKPERLLDIRKGNIEINDIANSFSNAVDARLSCIKNDKISLSLTGGADTRNLLATFLKKGIKPHLYTYGNPNSDDCVKAKAIADGLGLKHSIYNIRMDENLFEQYARKIIRLSGGLASIHRAHRLIAVENESAYAKSMFLGTLGGEYIKGVCEDDYIVPSIVYNNWNNDSFSYEQLQKYIQVKRLKTKEINTGLLLDFIRQEPYMKGTLITRKHNALSYITAHLHDAQDVNLYSSAMDNVFLPFLDIDYMELLFASYFTFDQKELIGNRFIKRMNNPIYGSMFIQATYKQLLKFKYSGEHKPSEVLFNKYYAAIVKILRKKTRPKYKPNFPLGKWMELFVENHLPLCAEYDVLNETFDIPTLLSDFKTSQYIPKESYWLKYTNPIMMRFIIEEFKS